MGALAIPPLNTTVMPKRTDDPAKVRDAARQFEALLIGQILHSARESGAGWLGAPEDSASDCATDYAEQQFAAVMAQAGGLGIAQMVELGLKAPVQPQDH
jgi:Rod binding domain-containing protein